MTDLAIRRLAPTDSLDALTSLLHRAFAPLAWRGLNCTCVDQSVATTRERVGLGDCFVAVVGRQVVGTVTLHATDPRAPVARYRDPAVASVHQLAVDPNRQGSGIGRALLHAAEHWTRQRRCLELALDTPAPAEHLRAYYGRQGFEPVEMVQLEGKSYVSVVLSKQIAPIAARVKPAPWPARHPAEMMLLSTSETRGSS